uniref:lysophospholipid acyltransferase family protein n=1 Tax=Candidatus Pelagibacter sp. HIMB1517 TaxID=3413341 RepID=UPI003F82DFE5
FIFVIFFFFIFKILRLKLSSNLSCLIFQKIGPLIRNNKTITKNLNLVFPNNDENENKKIIKNMWCNYGRTFAEYMFLGFFRKNKSLSIKVENLSKFDELKKLNRPLLFFSGHFANFELLAMTIEKNNFNICALYRPLNNIFLNPVMKYLRTKYLCKDQIPKSIPGKSKDGTRQLLNRIKNKKHIALMVDQKVNEGIKVDLFKKKALTINIPAQLALKHGYSLVPIEIKRESNANFVIHIKENIKINSEDNQLSITEKINTELEKMILNNPEQWIWTHDRWRI